MTTMRPLTEAERQEFAAVRARLLGGAGPNAKGYYAEAAFRIKPVAAEGLGTWAVDKHWRCYIDPANLPGGAAGWTVADCTEVFEHELGHLLRAHDERMHAHAGATQDAARSNIACDMEINDDLDPDGFIARIGVLPSKQNLPDNLTCEQYYDLLAEQAENGNDGSDGDGDGQGGTPNSGGMNGHGCGSGAGNPIAGELDADDPTAPVVGPGEATIARNGVAEAIKQHERVHGRGTVPGGLSEWADSVLAPPTVDWRKALRSAVRASVRMGKGRTDYSYTRLSRRASCVTNVALPGTYSPRPTISVVLDCSGSMSIDMIGEALNEIVGMSAQLGLEADELQIIQVDASVASIKPYRKSDAFEIHGRGGTDMRVGISAALDQKRKPMVTVVLTDGYTPWPDSKPRGTHLVVGIIGDGAGHVVEQTRSEMPWAKVLKIGD